MDGEGITFNGLNQIDEKVIFIQQFKLNGWKEVTIEQFKLNGWNEAQWFKQNGRRLNNYLTV